jgi:hypothetical protein
VSYSQTNPTEDCVVSNNDDIGYDVNKTYESASDLCRDFTVNAATGDKYNTTEDNAASVCNKRIPTEESVSHSQNNPAEDHVANNNDDVGYEVNNSYEFARKLSGDFEVNAAMGPIYTSPLTILANRNEWSSVSARFFIWTTQNRGVD